MAVLEALGEGRYALGGDLDFAAVARLWRDSPALFQGQAALQIDLACVGRSNSAAAALLVAWLGKAKQQGQALRFVNIPRQLERIISASALDQVLAESVIPAEFQAKTIN